MVTPKTEAITLYFVTSFRHLQDVAKDRAISELVANQEILFLTTEFVIKGELDRLGLPNDYLGTGMDAQEAFDCDRIAFQIASSWMLDDEGNDFTDFKDVSLGAAAQSVIYHRVAGASFFHLVLSVLMLLKKFSVRQLVCESSGITEIHGAMHHDPEILNIIANAYGIKFEMVKTMELADEDRWILAKQMPYPFANNKSSWYTGSPAGNWWFKNSVKTIFYEIVSAFKKLITAAPINMLLTIHSPMPQYLSHAFGVPSDGIRYHFLDGWKKDAVFSDKHGISFSLLSGKVSLSASEHEIYRNILSKFEVLKASQNYRSRFTFFGIDFSDYMLIQIEKILKSLLLLYMQQTIRFQRMLQQQKFDLLFTSYDAAWYATLLIDLCRQRNIPSVELIDGFRCSGSLISRLCDYVLCWSEHLKQQYFVEWLKKDDSHIFVTGTPLVESYQKCFPPNTLPKPLDRTNFRVLVGGLVYCATYMGKRWYDPERFLIDVLSVLAQFDGAQVTVRFRERDTLEYFKWLFYKYKKSAVPNIIFQDSEESSFEDEIAKHDIYITNDSTSAFEAALAGKYCVAYQLEAQRLDPPFDGKSSLMVPRSPEEFKECLESILSGRPHAYEFNRKEQLEKYIGPLEGASEKIYHTLLELIKRRSDNRKAFERSQACAIFQEASLKGVL